MLRILFALLVATLAINAGTQDARRYGSRSIARSKGTLPKSRSIGGHARATSSSCANCERDANGKIKRNPTARRDFQRHHPCPATGKTTGACPGYVVDHVVALKRGGLDSADNMQWQTIAEAKAKDRKARRPTEFSS